VGSNWQAGLCMLKISISMHFDSRLLVA